MEIKAFTATQSSYLAMLAAQGNALPQATNYPRERSLKAEMPPIVNQQFCRGTCSANAAVALAEYYFRSRNVRLSAQYLYAVARKLAEILGTKTGDEGLSVEETLAALWQCGTCRYDLAPYVRRQELPDFAEFSDACHQDASVYRTPTPTMINPPTSIETIKATICGVAHRLPMPVVIGVNVFSSFFEGARRPDGTIDLPRYVAIPGGDTTRFGTVEPLCGGHALLVVGYHDDATYPGGGWFEVLNSWGDGVGEAGYLRLPYAYVELFCDEAGTLFVDDANAPVDAGGVAGAKGGVPRPAPQASPSGLVQYETLTTDAFDADGVKRSAGTDVVRVGSVFVPRALGNFLSPAYLQELQKVVFRLGASIEQTSHCQQFTAKIDDNFSIGRMKMGLFPEPTSWNVFRIVGGRRIWHSDLVADFGDNLLDALASDMLNDMKNMSLPPELAGVKNMTPTADWKRSARTATVGKVYKISGYFPGRVVYAVEAFVTRWKFDVNLGFVPVKATACEVQRVIEQAEAAVPKLRDEKTLVFYAVGTGLPAEASYEEVARVAGHHVVTVSSHSLDGGKWSVRTAPNLTKRMPFRDFCDRLMPVTRDDLVSAVKECVDKVIHAGVTGRTMQVEEIVEELHAKSGPYGGFPCFRRTAVTRALLQLQGHDPTAYAVCRGASSERGAVVMSPCDVQPADRRFRGRSRLVNFLIHNVLRILAAALCSGLLICKVVYFKDVPYWQAGCAMVVTWLLGTWLQDKIVVLSEIEKE